MGEDDKKLVWLARPGIETPPFSNEARVHAGYLLRLLQKGEFIEEPESKPMPEVCKNCHELRIRDKNVWWRIIYHIADDAIILLEIFKKKTRKTPDYVIANAQYRYNRYYKDI